MLDAPESLHAANYAEECEREFPVLGVAALGVWVVSLAIGLFGLAIGREGPGIAALLVSVAAPWVGLALAYYPAVVRHLKRLVFQRRNSFGGIGVDQS